ncbi:hypothetical protein C475_11855 [Halosimplex carlsbadense 2-9-1]|uniref:Uncharacterized protein n=1 Tax=Halosimplex carlsbadense 2-9-1 TaxID=797114 RepID=M0CNT0_9EURY|nr:hypothetical protein [Halosimplex carlsbadense]ELZ24930.1 hypothetical protein C475_11855 [Halosimplex carlsbadense 2-9-1]
MNRWLAGLLGVAGTGAIGAGVLLAVALTPVTASEAGGGALVLVLTGLALAVGKLYRSGADGEAVAPAPWAEGGGLADGTPEETADPADVTGDELAALVVDACERARGAETVEEGFAVVRPPLRDALSRVLAAGGTDSDAVEELLATGAWTDDRVAAAVVDERVSLPRLSFRARLRAWLFPERVVRRGAARAVAAVDEAAERELPPVVGQEAPRTVPTLAPALGSLQRAADGRLQRAAGAERRRTDDGDGAADDDANGASVRESPSDERGDDPGTEGDADDPEDLLGEVWDDA